MTAAVGTMGAQTSAPAPLERPGAWHGGVISMQDQPTGIPYGYCHCGCGQKTKVSRETDRRNGYIKDQPRRYLRGHQGAAQPVSVEPYLIDAATGCWLWQRTVDHRGYGRIKVQGRTAYAHRIYYARLVGPIPEGLELDHLCRNRACVNPAHMEPVTGAVNVRRSPVAKLTEAKVRAIRRALAQGTPRRAVAAQYGVSKSCITNIAQRHTWKDIE